jgi:hypothetical protein
MKAISMHITKHACIISLFLSAIHPTLAAEPPQDLEAFRGTWECLDQVGTSILKSELSVVQVDQNLWKTIYVQEQNPLLDRPYRSEGIWGYNSFENKYYRYIFDNFNGSDLGFSPGFDGASFVWTGESVFFGDSFEYEGHFVFKDASHYESCYRSRKLALTPEPWQEMVRSDCKKKS